MNSKVNKKTKPPLVQVLDYGQLSNRKWPGSVSAAGLSAKGILTPEKLDEAVSRINEFYIPVNPMAKTRCIDGRHDPELDERMLGPQVPGGAPGAALAYRLGVDKDDLLRGSFIQDAESMIDRFVRLGFAPGGHRDNQPTGEQKAGCGAIDGMDVILATMTAPRLVDDHKRLVKELLAEEFSRDTYLRVMGAAVVVNGQSADYFRGREEIIDLLEKRAKHSVSTLIGEHQEVIIVANMVSDTTLASNRFYDTFGFQAFGYDIWRSKYMAKRLLPRDDAYQNTDRKRFITARIMTSVATLMALTDGSQHLLIRINK